MELLDILSKIYLGGLNDICIVNNDGSVAVTDVSNIVFVHVKPNKGTFVKLSNDIGIRDIDTFIKILSSAAEAKKGSISIRADNILTTDDDGKVRLRFADVDAIPRIENPEKVINSLRTQFKVSAVFKQAELHKFKRKYDQLKPEIVTIKVVKKEGITSLMCTLGEDIGHVGYVVLSRRVKTKIAECETVYRADYLMQVFGSITEEKVIVELGHKLPIMIEEHGSDYSVVWVLSPFDFVSG